MFLYIYVYKAFHVKDLVVRGTTLSALSGSENSSTSTNGRYQLSNIHTGKIFPTSINNKYWKEEKADEDEHVLNENKDV